MFEIWSSVWKSKYLKTNICEINLSQICGIYLWRQNYKGDLLICVGSAKYLVYKEPFCLISNYMKKFVREIPENYCLDLPAKYHSVIFLLQSLIYRKFGFVHHKKEDLLKELTSFLQIECTRNHHFRDFDEIDRLWHSHLFCRV